MNQNVSAVTMAPPPPQVPFTQHQQPPTEAMAALAVSNDNDHHKITVSQLDSGYGPKSIASSSPSPDDPNGQSAVTLSGSSEEPAVSEKPKSGSAGSGWGPKSFKQRLVDSQKTAHDTMSLKITTTKMECTTRGDQGVRRIALHVVTLC